MERIPSGGYSELISAAIDLLPLRIREHLTYVHWFCGSDPIFAGLIKTDKHNMQAAGYKFGPEVYLTGGSCSYAHNQTHLCEKRTTIVLPRLLPIDYPIHELGHVFDEVLDWSHNADPVTNYAETNDAEAFAEAFTSWLIPGYAKRPDDRTFALFTELAGR